MTARAGADTVVQGVTRAAVRAAVATVPAEEMRAGVVMAVIGVSRVRRPRVATADPALIATGVTRAAPIGAGDPLTAVQAGDPLTAVTTGLLARGATGVMTGPGWTGRTTVADRGAALDSVQPAGTAAVLALRPDPVRTAAMRIAAAGRMRGQVAALSGN
ncbi:MAG: hypothetical protein ACRDN1_06235 [Trebonia sp.]